MTITLREPDADNRDAVLALAVAPDQERFVGTVAGALAEAARYPEAKPWYRAVHADDAPVGFVMISWDVVPVPDDDIFGPWFLWKMIIDRAHQGRGHGAATVRHIADLVHAQGATELLTSYVPDDAGPAGFYRRLGFEPTGVRDSHGEPVVRLTLPI
jgi:diamine N-acetyltransferase